VNRLHVRFEDDYFSIAKPFSLGVVMDKLELATTDSDWTFDSKLDMNFFRVNPQHKDTSNQTNGGVLILKEVKLTNCRVYLNSLSEMFIPTSLWE